MIEGKVNLPCEDEIDVFKAIEIANTRGNNKFNPLGFDVVDGVLFVSIEFCVNSYVDLIFLGMSIESFRLIRIGAVKA